jgi:cellulose synthase (UDP-forming)
MFCQLNLLRRICCSASRLLRNGYITRYLCEHLAVGLAPEGLKAFFVQRRRWARGAMQILYLAAGPLGRDLTFMQRLLFLPTHWLSQSLMLLLISSPPWCSYGSGRCRWST